MNCLAIKFLGSVLSAEGHGIIAARILHGVLVISGCLARASTGGTETIDPFTVRSPSGAYEFRSDPGDRAAVGPSTIRLTRFGKVLWTKSVPYTLRSAMVDDRGEVGGFGYESGPRSLCLTCFDSSGKGTTVRTYRSQDHFFLGMVATPYVTDFAPDPAHHRFAVEIFDYSYDRKGGITDAWQVFDMHTGRLVGRHKGTGRYSNDDVLAPVPGTDLFVGYHHNYQGPQEDARPTLRALDVQGKVLCSTRTANTEYGFPRAPGSTNDVQFRPAGNRQVDLILPARGQRLRYALDRTPSGAYSWRKVSQSIYSELPSAVGESAFRSVPLIEDHRRSLGLPGVPGDVREVTGIAPLGNGHLALTRWLENNDQYAVMWADQTGRIESWLKPIPAIGDARQFRTIGLNRGRFLLLGIDSPGPDGWIFNPKVNNFERWQMPKAMTELKARTSSEFVVSASGDGGLLAWGAYSDGSVTEVQRYTPDNRLLWTFKSKHEDDRNQLQSIIDLTAYGEGAALLDAQNGNISLIGGDGKLKRTLDLHTDGGETYSDRYFPERAIRALPNGDLVIADSLKGRLTTISSDGRILKSVVPRFPNGGRIQAFRGLFVTDAGELWGADDYCGFRLSRSGVVDMVVGDEPSLDKVHGIKCARIGPAPIVSLLDTRTNAIHVFDLRGIHLHTSLCSLGLGEEADAVSLGISRDGSSVAACGRALEFFGKDGSRSTGGPIEGGSTWTTAGLINDRGQVVAPFARRADGKWIRDVQDVAEAPDGAAAMLERDGFQPERNFVTIFSKGGSPLTSFEVEHDDGNSSLFAFDGKTLLHGVNGQLRAYGATGHPLWRAQMGTPTVPWLACVGLVDGVVYGLDDNLWLRAYRPVK